MVAARTAAIDRLRGLDRRLGEQLGRLRSLAPGRERATPLAEIGERLLPPEAATEVADAFSIALAAMVEAQLEGFPENLFWDFDFGAARLFAALADGEPASSAGPAAALVVSLQRTFGRTSKIRFRYTHDFTYGFDWARWVQRDARARSAVGPLDVEFLRYMQGRGAELLDLIEQNDAKYPQIAEGTARNPFGFSREPRDEELLHRHLAERGLIPVEAWRLEAAPRWDLPFSDLREERARELGLFRR